MENEQLRAENVQVTVKEEVLHIEESTSRKQNVIAEKSVAFAINIVEVYKVLCDQRKEFVLSKQLVRSGTSIGAMVREAEHAESKPDFLHKMSVALKEANETQYWLYLLLKSGYLEQATHTSLRRENDELIRLLASIVKTVKTKLKK